MSTTRILLVEDDHHVALHTRALLEELHHKIVGICATGEAAVSAVKEEAPELILMDIELSGEMDGIEAARLIGANRDLPIIYLTSHTEEVLLQRAKLTEPYAYLVKPLRLEQIQVAIEVGLYRHQQATQRKRLEQEIVDKNSQLEGMNRELARRNVDLRIFANTVSHDLKAPLRALHGYANELGKYHVGLDDRARFCIQQIVDSTQNLSHLLDDLLKYAGIDRDLPGEAQIDLNELLRSLLLDRQAAIRESETQIEIVVPADFQVVCAGTALRQVLANLLDNAIKYSKDANPPKVCVQAEQLPAWYKLSIHDNGIGFDMRHHERIYHLFQRLVTASHYEGTGSGLAIAQKLVDKLGGRLYAQATPRQGASFYVELPRSG